MQNPVRFSSCRGVAFEIKPHADPFSIKSPTDGRRSCKKFWPFGSEGSSSKVFPFSVTRSMNRGSSHFCDLAIENGDDNGDVVKILGRSWVPIPIKTATTSLLRSPGAIQSSCAVSSVAWLIYSYVLTLKHRENTSSEIIGVASAMLSLFCLSCLAAFPLIRHLHHNVFERIRRFAGWTALGLLWAFIILTISYDPKTKSYACVLGSRLIERQEFWLTIAITVLIIIPWLTVGRVPVRVSAISGHASVTKFEAGVKAGVLVRISPVKRIILYNKCNKSNMPSR